jgi:hypothetical protein
MVRPRLLVLALAVSLALNALLLTTIWANTRLLREVTLDLEAARGSMAPLLSRYVRAARDADDLRVQLRECTLRQVRRILEDADPPSPSAPARGSKPETPAPAG